MSRQEHTRKPQLLLVLRLVGADLEDELHGQVPRRIQGEAMSQIRVICCKRCRIAMVQQVQLYLDDE
jgi:hypothetical protein